jgi:hypothetical protein
MSNPAPPSDRHSDSSTQLQEIRVRHHERRFLQLNGLLIGHSEGSLQYLLAVNGGGAVAMLGLVGAVEKWRIQNWPYWVLAVFVLGLTLSGLARAVILIHSQQLVSGWIADSNAYFQNQLEWRDLEGRDSKRVKHFRWLPWTLGLISMLCFIGGTISAGYLFFTLREAHAAITLAGPEKLEWVRAVPSSHETGATMSAGIAAALIAACVALIAMYCTQFLAENYRRFKEGSAIAAGLAGELSSYKEAAPLLKKFFDDSLEMIQTGKKDQLLFRSLEKPVDRYYEEVVGKIGLLGPEIAEQISFVYSNLNAFRGAFMLINDHHKDMSAAELTARITLCVSAMDRAFSAGWTLTQTLKERSVARFNPLG